MMHVRTLKFGELEVPKENVIEFKEGIPGFPYIRRFAMLDVEEVRPFQYLQALEAESFAFLVIDPFLLEPKYEFQLSAQDMEDIGFANPEEITVCVVATIPENPAETTLNLKAPIVINVKMQCGKQVILHDSPYSVRHPQVKMVDSGRNGRT